MIKNISLSLLALSSINIFSAALHYQMLPVGLDRLIKVTQGTKGIQHTSAIKDTGLAGVAVFLLASEHLNAWAPTVATDIVNELGCVHLHDYDDRSCVERRMEDLLLKHASEEGLMHQNLISKTAAVLFLITHHKIKACILHRPEKRVDKEFCSDIFGFCLNKTSVKPDFHFLDECGSAELRELKRRNIESASKKWQRAISGCYVGIEFDRAAACDYFSRRPTGSCVGCQVL